MISPKTIIEKAGTYSKAVDSVMLLGRILWDLAFVSREAPAPGRHTRAIDRSNILEALDDSLKEIVELLLVRLQEKKFVREAGNGSLHLDLSIFQPLALARECLENIKPDHELRYFVMKNIRSYYGYDPSPSTAYLFNLLASALNSLRIPERENLLLRKVDFKNINNLIIKLRKSEDNVSHYIHSCLSTELRTLIDEYNSPGLESEASEDRLIQELNQLLQSQDFYRPDHFTGVRLTLSAKMMLLGRPKGKDLININRHLLTRAYPDEIEARKHRKTESGSNTGNKRNKFNYPKEILPYLRQLLKDDVKFTGEPDKAINLFIESCRVASFIRSHYTSGTISIQTETIDPEFLLGNLFGLPTGIQGFDDLFGGGGLMLAEGVHNVTTDKLKGRTILVIGRFGTGKSLLSLQLAVEVARKGGFAWLMPLEQSAEECLYSLEAMRALPNDQSVEIITKHTHLKEFLEKKSGIGESKGVLVILTSIKDSFDDFWADFAASAKRMQDYPIRLISVDPINSVSRVHNPNTTELRAKTLERIKEIEDTGTNILLVAEEGSENDEELLFEQNIADTVIHLSLIDRHGFAQRYLEIKKSRLQREQRGKHPFSITAGTGIRINLSTAAVSRRIRPRSVRAPGKEISYGLDTFDKILGKDGITAGDVIVFQGTGGSFKTPLGMFFLLGSDWDLSHQEVRARKNYSLLISARDDETTIRHMLSRDFIQEHWLENNTKAPEDIIIQPIPKGYINPSIIIQLIEDVFNNVRLQGNSIDRVMVDNIAHWEISCPFVREDATFADTLVDFLRRQRVSTLLVCGDIPDSVRSVVQRPLIDNADCVIRFDRVEFRGLHHVMVRVIKTRGMQHRRESFELSFNQNSLEIKPGPSMLRIGENGQLFPVKTRLFLHSETEMQEEYNLDFLTTLRSVLSRDSEIEPQSPIYMDRAAILRASSAIDELQVIQLDEFQLPSIQDEDSKRFSLHVFNHSQWIEEWDDLLPRLRERIDSDDESFFAIPFYENVSFLAYNNEKISEELTNSWADLAWECEKWEKVHPDPTSLFFDFPRVTEENYNCLFFEILLSIEDIPKWVGSCQLQDWIARDSTIQASILFRKLCRRAYKTDKAINLSRGLSKIFIQVNPNAIVWRHWYSTLNQMLYDINPDARDKIRIKSLPGYKSIAGEWYLAVPSYSGAPDIGLEIIKLLTSRESELDRVRLGVGLPTRSFFYDTGQELNSIDAGISPYFSIDSVVLKRLVETAFRRSSFGCYSQFSGILAHHLKKILEIDLENEKAIEDRVRTVFDGLASRIRFVSPERDCSKCVVKCGESNLV